MNPFHIILLGLVQGLTEFIPVSSEGHLAVLNHLFPVPPGQAPELEVSLRAGVLLAAIVFFRREIFALGTVPFSRVPSGARETERRRLLFILIAAVLALFVGSLLKPCVEVVESFLPAAGVGLLLTTLFLLGGELGGKSRVTTSVIDMSFWHPVLLGAVQGLAVWPGLSLVGATVGLALFMGWSWTDAGRFGLVTTLPAAAASLFAVARSLTGLPHAGTVVPGLIASFLAGLIALRLLMRILASRTLWPAAAYTSLLGIYALMN